MLITYDLAGAPLTAEKLLEIYGSVFDAQLEHKGEVEV